MIKQFLFSTTTVKTLTRFLLLSFVFLAPTSCSYIYGRYGETCNSHAYLNRVLNEHISSRFYKHAPVRLAIIPFSTPANLSVRNAESPGLGNEMAWQIHRYLLASEEVPIVEVLNRQDWPAKKDEFFTGNYGALNMARDANYDLVLVGLVEQQKALDTLVVYSKVIDVESGVTVWYGKTRAVTNRREFDDWTWHFGMTSKDPSALYFDTLIDKTSQCIVKAVLNQDEEESAS
jgi:hypothetical protein